jgi:hypothetical protein
MIGGKRRDAAMIDQNVQEIPRDACQLQHLRDAPTTARFRPAGTAGVTSAFCNSVDPSSAAAKARNSRDGVLRREPGTRRR